MLRRSITIIRRSQGQNQTLVMCPRLCVRGIPHRPILRRFCILIPSPNEHAAAIARTINGWPQVMTKLKLNTDGALGTLTARRLAGS